jgi:hypothetical protein
MKPMKLWQKLGLLVVGAVLWTGSAHAQTTLRYKFKEGDKFGYVMEQKMKISTSVMGKDVEMNMNQGMDMSWHVLKVDKDGNAEVKMAFSGAKMSMDGPMGKVEVDSKNPKQPDDPIGKILSQTVAALAELEMTFTMDSVGEIKDIKMPEKVKNNLKAMPGAEAMGDLFSDEGLKKMAQGGVVLPREAVSKGKTWSTKADMKMPFGKIKGDIQFTYDEAVEKDGKKLEKIALKPNVTIEAAPNAPLQLKLKSQEGKGYMYFDNVAGKLAEVDSTQIMEMTVEANNMTIQQKIEQKTTMKLRK